MAVSLTITSDLQMPLSAENLPQTVTLTASGTDSADNSANFNYSWHIIDKPPESSAVLSALVGTNITIDIDTWGTYRVFCIATNIATNESSEDNPYEAPLNSFFSVRVESENFDLEKPAKSQRNWHPQYWHLVDVVEAMEQDPATFIKGGSVEIASALEIAQQAGRNDSTSGEHYLAVTTEELFGALHPTVNGNLGSSGINVLRNRVKDIALEKINESSITELKDVDTTTITAQPGQALIWSPTHTDDTNGDTGAWIPGDVSGSSTLFGQGLCAGETLDGGDFLIYDANCLESQVAIQPGWHARNRLETSLHDYLPKAAPGLNSNWHSAAVAAGKTWEDNILHPGQVSVGDFYHIAKGMNYDTDQYDTTAALSAISLGSLPSITMTSGHFIGALTGAGIPVQSNYSFVADGFDEEDIQFYDPLYHTAAEVATLTANVSNGTYDGVSPNALQQAMTGFIHSRLGRSSITRLADVDTTTHVPVDNDFLVWDSSHTDDQGGTGAFIPKSAAEMGLGSGGGVDGLTSNSTDTITLDSGYTIIPSADNGQDLGSDTKAFRRIYVNELTGDNDSTDNLDTRLSLNATIPGNAAAGLRAAALMSRGSIAMMIDTNNTGQDTTNSFFVYEGGEDDSNATERFSVQNDGNVRINNAYSLPTSDGSQNEVMITNGNGQCSFVDVDTIVTASAGQTYQMAYSEALLGNFANEIPYNNSGYSIGTGESPLMFMFRNVSGKTLKLKNFTFTCAHMHSSTMTMSFVGFTHNQLLANNYTTISNEFTVGRSNTDVNTNNEGIGSVEQTLGSVTISDGEYFGVFMNSFEKSGHDNERFFITVEATE